MKMKKYPSFDEFYRDQAPQTRAVLRKPTDLDAVAFKALLKQALAKP